MSPPALNWVLLYVADTRRSADFYKRLLGCAPVAEPASGKDFTMFSLPGGWTLGLWNRNEVEPRATLPGGAELSFTEATGEIVRERFAEWRAAGIRMLQPVTETDFGITFTAADPDGHRLRVFSPPAA
ncbi:MAG TPA: VOC family protein [Devosia sp.]|jgi:predicted enzyme related to lactoylglutathione lyase|nr:VOC family protein [Devosia sp.]